MRAGRTRAPWSVAAGAKRLGFGWVCYRGRAAHLRGLPRLEDADAAEAVCPVPAAGGPAAALREDIRHSFRSSALRRNTMGPLVQVGEHTASREFIAMREGAPGTAWWCGSRTPPLRPATRHTPWYAADATRGDASAQSTFGRPTLGAPTFLGPRPWMLGRRALNKGL